MKKISALLLFAAVLLFACSRKASPSISKQTGPVPADTVRTEVKTEEQVKTALPPNSLSVDIEAGKAVYTTKCTRCHGAKNVANWNVKQWESILRSMVPRSKLTADEERQVTAYVKANAKAE